MKSIIKSLHKTILSFRYAWIGLRYMIKRENNFRFHLFAVLVTVGTGLWLHINKTEWITVCVMMGLVLSMETLNTAVERLTDYVCPDRHPAAGLVKDLAAAAVLIISMVALGVGLAIFIPAFVRLYL